MVLCRETDLINVMKSTLFFSKYFLHLSDICTFKTVFVGNKVKLEPCKLNKFRSSTSFRFKSSSIISVPSELLNSLVIKLIRSEIKDKSSPHNIYTCFIAHARKEEYSISSALATAL